MDGSDVRGDPRPARTAGTNEGFGWRQASKRGGRVSPATATPGAGGAGGASDSRRRARGQAPGAGRGSGGGPGRAVPALRRGGLRPGAADARGVARGRRSAAGGVLAPVAVRRKLPGRAGALHHLAPARGDQPGHQRAAEARPAPPHVAPDPAAGRAGEGRAPPGGCRRPGPGRAGPGLAGRAAADRQRRPGHPACGTAPGGRAGLLRGPDPRSDRRDAGCAIEHGQDPPGPRPAQAGRLPERQGVSRADCLG